MTPQTPSIQSTVFGAPLNQIDRESSSFRHFLIVPKLVLKTIQSGTKVNTVRLMRDRWWSNCARFIKKAVNTWLRFKTGAKGQNGLCGHTKGLDSASTDGKEFPTMSHVFIKQAGKLNESLILTRCPQGLIDCYMSGGK